MVDTRIKISSVIENQLPTFVKEEFPLVNEFLSQYYLSLEGKGSTLDIFQNIDQYIKVDNLSNLTDSTTLTNDVDFFDETIYVSSTYGFPESYGLIQIDSEIITYTGITSNSFTGCIRGFSGVTSYSGTNTPDELVFSKSEIALHNSETTVINLSVLFLKEFFKKVKKQVLPGFEDRELDSQLNQNLFVKQAKDFYSSKGTDGSFKILFKAIYGEDVEVIKPRDYLFIPSDAKYRVTRDLVVESIEGNPENLLNRTLFQDKTDIFPAARGSINEIQKIYGGDRDYYVLSLDYDFNKDIDVEGSIFGKFSIHPKTKLITTANIGATTLDVDSTVGFPNSGTLIVEFSNGSSSTINYNSKSLTQFFECSGVDQVIEPKQDLRLDAYAYGYSGSDTSNIVKVRITGVLSDFDPLPPNYYFQPEEIIGAKSLGTQFTSNAANNWFFNISIRSNVRSIRLLNNINYSYAVETYDKNSFRVGDTIKLSSSDGVDAVGVVSLINNEYEFIIKNQGVLDENKTYIVTRILSRVNSSNYPELSVYTTNVQNVYSDKKSLYVSSPSLPSYLDQTLNVNDRSVTFSGSFSGETISIENHGFYTGDSVTYIPGSATDNNIGISSGIYFVKKIDDNNIKLSKSRSNIYSSKFLSVDGTATNNKFVLTNFYNKSLQPQKLIRKISTPINEATNTETTPGLTGILINGVEILNYKSSDSIFYGPIQKVDVTSGGSDYDVINPPVLEVSDLVGTGVSCFCEVEGSIKRIDVINEGFDYVSEPIITITGGNGQGAIAKANLFQVEHSVPFNSNVSAGQVNLTNNTIGFSTYHKFRDGESIIYKTNNQTAVGGLSTDSVYYASVQNQYDIKLHKTFDDAIVGINTIQLLSYGSNNHEFKSTKLKSILSSISVINGGIGYRNRKTTVNSSGININSDIITIENHKYQTGELVTYTPGTSPIGGLSTGNYYVTKVNDNSFKLSAVGVGSISKEEYFKNQEYISFTSTGSGTQTFNYPQIEVKISGIVGVSTRTGQDFNAILNPIVRGEIKSVFVNSGGVGYGSSEILNYNRQPEFTIKTGEEAELKPIVSNGRITDVVVLKGGSGYNCTPNLVISGSGTGATLTPIIINGTIVSVKINHQGSGFVQGKTSITVVPAGSSARFYSQPKKWTVNIFERLLQNNQISSDDGVICNGIGKDYGLEYSSLYAPRKLRSSTFGTKYVNGNLVYIPDLVLENNNEVSSGTHSPIIGWSYDGNPIYGPYGYSSITGGPVRLMKSGYKVEINSDRPSTSLYPEGFFVEDYVYDNSGDLDEFNGRFCITPEYPNGTYAYFSTFETSSLDSETNSPFKNYRRPKFPYLIGNYYKSKPIEYNFDYTSNQDNFNSLSSYLLRNTTPYNLLSENSYYDFLLEPNKIRNQYSRISSTTLGRVDSIGITTTGDLYQPNDRIVFDNTETGGLGAAAKISYVKGKTINEISIASTSINHVEFYPHNSSLSYIGFSSYPHNLKNLDIISISGLSTTLNSLQSSYIASIPEDIFVLSATISSSTTTGIVTYFSVYGNLDFPFIRENDILTIESEKVKVLSIDKKSSRIRVIREYDVTVGSSHTTFTELKSDSRRVIINGSLSNSSSFDLNKEIYFDPSESLGIGTISGVGIGYTLNFSNPGVGITQIFIPTKSIYLPNHRLNTGDEIIYSSNGGDSISVSINGTSSYTINNNQILYVARINDDLIGIATNRVGLGSTGSFVGINSSFITNTLYFTGIGTGVYHSFKTNYDNILRGSIDKNVVTVSTASTHGLVVDDSIVLTALPGITTTIVIRYNDTNRRMLVNPRNFSPSDVDVENSIITIVNHDYKTGDKVIHTSSSPSIGLLNDEIYFVYVVDNNKIKLTKTRYNLIQKYPIFVSITGSSNGTISKVNPEILLVKNQLVNFDLSDSSLSFENNSQTYPAFDFDLFVDENLTDKFYSSRKTNAFEVSKVGNIGIDSTAKLILKVTDDIPQKLYYSLKPINLDLNSNTKKEIFLDKVYNSSAGSISFVKNTLNDTHKITGIGSTVFSFNILNLPEKNKYDSTDGIFEYETNSTTSYGPISKVRITSPGNGYKKIPTISSITSLYGSGAILIPQSNTIGNISNINIVDIGFDYPSDITLRPEAQISQLIKVSRLSTFDKIGISSVGKNYLTSPNLVVVDSVTNNVVTDVDLRCDLKNYKITIFKNATDLSDIPPKIIPINNSNGIGISSITYNEITKDVILDLAVGYSSIEDFPFNIGDEILIENVSVGIGSIAKGYNSKNYNYSLFKITSVSPNIGGYGSITYSLKDYLKTDEFPGSYDPINSSGKVIPEKYFPIFSITLKKNNFFIGETISSNISSGKIVSFDNQSQTLKVFSPEVFNVGDKLIGNTSNNQCIVDSVVTFDVNYKVDSTSIVTKGWKEDTGFLNNNLQRIFDSDYYQYFSYEIKSKIPYDKWNNLVSSLNHTVGFKKFANLVIESVQTVGIKTEQDFIGTEVSSDLVSIVDLNCEYDFDLAKERSILIDSSVYSDEIILNSKAVQDYIESIGNRVLVIDDISNLFNDNPRTDRFSVVDNFTLSSNRSKKYIIYVQDKRIANDKQMCIVSLTHNDSNVVFNQYGRVETVRDLGNFDFDIFGSEGRLLFYPTKYRVNSYFVNTISYSIGDSVSGIGTLQLGDTVNILSSTTTIPQGTSTPTTIVGIATTYRTSKILVQYADTEGSYFEYDELTMIHNGSTVDLLEYGQLTTDNVTSFGSSGLGNYSAYISGGNVNIDFTPTVGLGFTCNVNTVQISIANTSSSSISTSVLNTGFLDSNITTIPSSVSPTEHVVAEYPKSQFYSGAYYFVSVEDLTNNNYYSSEIISVDDGTSAYMSEFGVVKTGSDVGTFDVAISGEKVQLKFTPIANASIQVRLIQNALRLVDDESTETTIDLTNATIESSFGTYEGTDVDVRRSFDLTHKNLPIFQRSFAGLSSSVVDIEKNVIKIPNHFFTTGEELIYSPGPSTLNAIGIATTTISGIGLTDKLPTTVYAIKVNDSSIRLSSSAENALKIVPVPLVLSSVGIDRYHSLTCKRQNSRVLIGIDNVIQSPIVNTSIKTTLSTKVLSTDEMIAVSGITSFFGGDLIKIDDEIMKIDTVGFGSTNVFLITRGWMGTGISTHSEGGLVTKITGDYNIVDNTINFITAPHGKTPIGTTSGSPDNVDYLGISTYSSFSGRVFIRNSIPNTSSEPYSKNYVFDDISSSFTGYSTSFNITSNGSNVAGVSTDNAIILVNQIFQNPQRTIGYSLDIIGDYSLKENIGITSIQFTGSISSTSYDVNSSNVPVGGIIVSVGSSKGFGYQPLVSAGGTAIISGIGTISSISIGNSGSGYRSQIQVVNVGVKTEGLDDTNITYIGIASISNGSVVSVAITNPGIGYTISNPPIVVFDSPLSYSNIPLVYSSSSRAGFGTGATANIVVGQGSSVIDFEITNFGYGYGQGEILTVGVGGSLGLLTDPSLTFEEFTISIDRTYSDSFSGWTFGSLLVIDSIDSMFDGNTKSFPIKIDGVQKTIRAKKGSLIDVEATLLVFINDILQVPGNGYLFKGGSYIIFTEAPKPGDRSSILFYQGTSSVDVLDVDVLESIKVGDDVTLYDENIAYYEDPRFVTNINSSDSIDTNVYPGPGVNSDENYLRPLVWCKQSDDLFIEGKSVTKNREIYEPLIYPTTNIIRSVGIGSTVIFVESVKTFFDNEKENNLKNNVIKIISQDSVVSASGTAVVSVAGTIMSISITNGGFGYDVAPTVTIANPIGFGTTQRAEAVSSITAGIVTSITITSPGSGYTNTNPPIVLIEDPNPSSAIEEISSVTYTGDFGIISGISTVSVGVASTGIVFDLLIPENSFLRDESIVGTAITVSGIQTGYYFIVYNSNVGKGVTSLSSNGSIIGIGNSFLDNVYEVSSVSIAQTSAVGFGVTYVAKVTVSVRSYNGLTGIGYSRFYGEYSWGRISASGRTDQKQFTAYNNGIVGVSTSPIVIRKNSLKYSNYV